MKTHLLAPAIAALALATAHAQITVTNDSGGTTTVDSGPDQANKTTTFSSWSLNGGNTVAVFFSAEGQDLSTATYGGQGMTIIHDTSGDRWDAAIAYLIDPNVTTGDIVLSWVETPTGDDGQNEIAYTPFALGGVGGVAAMDSKEGGNLTFNYTTALPGGYVLGNATNNSFNFGSPPTVSGDHLDSSDSNDYEYYLNVSGNFSTIHAHDSVPTAGTYSETFSNLESVAAVAFEASAVVASDPFPLTITPATSPDSGFDLAWDSQTGKLYNLRTSEDLAGAISTWTLVQGDIAATPPTNSFNVDPGDPKRFYAVEEFDAPAQ